VGRLLGGRRLRVLVVSVTTCLSAVVLCAVARGAGYSFLPSLLSRGRVFDFSAPWNL